MGNSTSTEAAPEGETNAAAAFFESLGKAEKWEKMGDDMKTGLEKAYDDIKGGVEGLVPAAEAAPAEEAPAEETPAETPAVE